jgi:hypothetical protein
MTRSVLLGLSLLALGFAGGLWWWLWSRERGRGGRGELHTAGVEDCACTASGACEAGLTCTSNLCVTLGGTGGTATGSASGSATGGRGGEAGSTYGAGGASTGGSVGMGGAVGAGGRQAALGQTRDQDQRFPARCRQCAARRRLAAR